MSRALEVRYKTTLKAENRTWIIEEAVGGHFYVRTTCDCGQEASASITKLCTFAQVLCSEIGKGCNKYMRVPAIVFHTAKDALTLRDDMMIEEGRGPTLWIPDC